MIFCYFTSASIFWGVSYGTPIKGIISRIKAYNHIIKITKVFLVAKILINSHSLSVRRTSVIEISLDCNTLSNRIGEI